MDCGQTHAKWYYILIFTLITGVGVGLLFVIPHAGVNECRTNDERWIVAILSAFFSFGGLYHLLGYAFTKTRWTETSIYHSTPIRTVTADWSGIDHISFSNLTGLMTVKFVNGVTVKVAKNVANFTDFVNAADRHYGLKKPWRVLQPAFRIFVDESRNCGCLQCGSIFPTFDIQAWDREDKTHDAPHDAAVCLKCGSAESLVCDGGIVKFTRNDLRKINDELDADLHPRERERRSRLRVHFGFAR